MANSLVASILSLLHAYQLHRRKEALVLSAIIPAGDASDASASGTAGSLCFAWGGDLLVVGIIANYASVAADTFSSELGILSRSAPRLITSPTLRRVPPGTNGGVTLVGLAAGLAGSVVVVAASALFLPFCGEDSAGKPGGAATPWTADQRRVLMFGLALWGALGSVLDSVLGAVLQRSVRDVRSGKIVEGEGGVRVLVSHAAGTTGPDGSRSFDADVDIKSALFSGEGRDAVENQDHDVVVVEEDDAKDDEPGRPYGKYDVRKQHRRPSFGDERPSRVAESGWDLLDNNDVNLLMALTMSVGAMGIAGWYWGVPMSQIIQPY